MYPTGGGFASPIRNHRGETVAAISLSVPVFRLDPDKRRTLSQFVQLGARSSATDWDNAIPGCKCGHWTNYERGGNKHKRLAARTRPLQQGLRLSARESIHSRGRLGCVALLNGPLNPIAASQVAAHNDSIDVAGGL